MKSADACLYVAGLDFGGLCLKGVTMIPYLGPEMIMALQTLFRWAAKNPSRAQLHERKLTFNVDSFARSGFRSIKTEIRFQTIFALLR
jgi:hypothetical protein